MNRPREEEFYRVYNIPTRLKEPIRIFNQEDYIKTLEKYCDFLEIENANNPTIVEYISKLEQENIKYEEENKKMEEALNDIVNPFYEELKEYQKALDKACSMLARNTICNDCQIECTELREEDLINGECRWHAESKEEWKEWLLNEKKEI